jgi:AraC-like DNA-binding protein
MANHAGLIIQPSRPQGTFDANSDGRNVNSEVESLFARKLSQHIKMLIANQQWSYLQTPELAVHAGYSTRQFHLHFVKAFGETPHAWVLNTRLSLALESPLVGDPISFVAVRYGFADSSHFARKFRERYGCSPTDAASLVKA